MAISSISRIQHRRGVQADLPSQLAEGEFGWCLDSRRLYIGNSDGYGDNTEVLTQYSDNGELVKNIFSALDYQPTTSITRELSDKLNDVANIKDFGVIGDGVTDDTDAINAAIRSLLYGSEFVSGSPSTPLDQALRLTIHVPAGTYLISSPILLYPNLTLVGDGMGNTIFLCTDDTMTCMAQTVDSYGNTGANIGISGGELPIRISLRNMSFYTDNNDIHGLQLDRVATVRLENVELSGGWTHGQGSTTDTSIGIKCTTIGSGYIGTVGDLQLIGVIITGFTYGLYINDPVRFIAISRAKIRFCYRGINLGEIPAYSGPSWTSIFQSLIYSIDDAAIAVYSPNPGITSIGNSYLTCNVDSGLYPIFWGNSSNNNISIGDVFSVAPGINNLGSNNLIFDTQQNEFLQKRVRVITAAGPITILSTDNVVIVNKTVGAATAVTLPTSPLTGVNFIIKDGRGDAFTNNITITPPVGTIDGAATLVMNTNFQAATLVYNGTQWNVI